MSRFVSKEPVPVTDGEDTVWIKPEMDYATHNAVLSAATKVETADGGRGSADVGAYQMALLEKNIVRWDGPGFGGRPCTPANIGAMKPNDPLLAKVLEEIGRRNPQGKAPSSAPTDGSDSSAA